MKRWLLLSLVLVPHLLVGQVNGSRALKKCAEFIAEGLSLSEVFILYTGRKLNSEHKIPRAQAATFRFVRVEAAEATATKAELEELFAGVLKDYKLTIADWKSVQDIEFEDAVLGSPEFMMAVNAKKVDGKKLTEQQINTFRRLNQASEAAREKMKAMLSASEQLSFAESKTLLSEDALLSLLRRFSKNPKLGWEFIGVSDLEAWRYQLITEREHFRKDIEKTLTDSILAIVAISNEIPESENTTFGLIAEKLGVKEADVRVHFGENRVFKNMNELVEATRRKNPGAFVKVVDRRYFNGAKRKAMLDAIRNANDIVLFKLAENQDLTGFEAIKALAKSLNAPIIVAPAFAEIGLIPEKLDWLFNEPNVHFMIDRGVQLSRDFYVVDHGYEDKRQNPFTGLHQIYAPTDRVVTFHPKVRAETRATANYDTRPGYLVTTGSMSDPAYWGKFRISMSTDERAQLEAEINRSVLVLSRRYRSDKFGRMVGSANGIAPRRVRYTEARYGNPAGLFDLGKLYTEKGIVELDALAAIVLGDVHLGNTDPLFLKATHETLESLKIIEKNPNFGQPLQFEYRKGPVRLGAIVLHDLIDGGPNNRHNMDSLLTRALEDRNGGLDLENHVQSAAAWVKQLTQLLPDTKIVVPVDNHGSDWLVKRLQEADLFKGGRPKEVPLVLKLMVDAIEAKANPYERVFQYYGIDTDQVLFLSKEETYRAGIDLQSPTPFRMTHGVEIGQHSHMGVNGAKSISLQRLLVAYGANVTGHTHSSAEYGTSVKVGTGTPPRQGYHRGPSNSDASIALVYSDQAVQLLRMEKGCFIPTAEDQRAAEFFPSEEYPRLLTRKMPPGGATTDQFRSDPPSERHPR